MPGYASSGGCKTRRVFCEGDEKDAEEEEGKDAEEEEEEDDADEEEAEEEEEDNAAWSEIRSFAFIASLVQEMRHTITISPRHCTESAAPIPSHRPSMPSENPFPL